MNISRTQKNSVFVRFCFFAFAAYVAVSLITLQMEINSKKIQLAQIEDLQYEQHMLQKDLERQLAMGEDESYMARIAREKLDMGFSDEHVYRDASGS